jgi:hypothetical protein
MLPHEERVVTEKNELDDKIEKLSKFIKGPTFENLENFQKQCLNKQLNIMQSYSDVLTERISHFKE